MPEHRLVVDVYHRPTKVGDKKLRYSRSWHGLYMPPVGAAVAVGGRRADCHTLTYVRQVIWYPGGGSSIYLIPFFVDPAVEIERMVLRTPSSGVVWSTEAEEAELVEVLESQGFEWGVLEDAGCR